MIFPKETPTIPWLPNKSQKSQKSKESQESSKNHKKIPKGQKIPNPYAILRNERDVQWTSCFNPPPPTDNVHPHTMI